jgi:hypothetical protein
MGGWIASHGSVYAGDQLLLYRATLSGNPGAVESIRDRRRIDQLAESVATPGDR